MKVKPDVLSLPGPAGSWRQVQCPLFNLESDKWPEPATLSPDLDVGKVRGTQCPADFALGLRTFNGRRGRKLGDLPGTLGRGHNLSVSKSPELRTRSRVNLGLWGFAAVRRTSRTFSFKCWKNHPFSRVSERRHRMKLVTVTLMFLGSFAFLGADTARLDASSQFRKKWNKWALSHGKRELQASSSYPTGLADEKTVPTQTLAQLQDKQSTSSTPQASTQSVAHIRVKRYRQSMNQGSRSAGCRFGTCTVQKLAHQIYQFTDKDKDSVAPRNKISSQGYGRRRRRSLPEILRIRTVVSSQEQAHAAPASQAQPNHLQAL